MQRYVAFLGGINVGGHRVKGPALAAEFATLGFSDVATFLASGNVVFSAAPTPPARLAAGIEQQLERALGYAVPTFLRSAEQVRHIAAHRPFADELVAASNGKLQVVMLREPPDAATRAAVGEVSDERDRLAVDGTELYWLPSGGISESDLDWSRLAGLGPSTMRTANTVQRIVARFLDA